MATVTLQGRHAMSVANILATASRRSKNARKDVFWARFESWLCRCGKYSQVILPFHWQPLN